VKSENVENKTMQKDLENEGKGKQPMCKKTQKELQYETTRKKLEDEKRTKDVENEQIQNKFIVNKKHGINYKRKRHRKNRIETV